MQMEISLLFFLMFNKFAMFFSSQKNVQIFAKINLKIRNLRKKNYYTEKNNKQQPFLFNVTFLTFVYLMHRLKKRRKKNDYSHS